VHSPPVGGCASSLGGGTADFRIPLMGVQSVAVACRGVATSAAFLPFDTGVQSVALACRDSVVEVG
jgi:hypothetical protein